jgi:hypothetical protein
MLPWGAQVASRGEQEVAQQQQQQQQQQQLQISCSP